MRAHFSLMVKSEWTKAVLLIGNLLFLLLILIEIAVKISLEITLYEIDGTLVPNILSKGIILLSMHLLLLLV